MVLILSKYYYFRCFTEKIETVVFSLRDFLPPRLSEYLTNLFEDLHTLVKIGDDYPYYPRHIWSRCATGGDSTPPLENTLGGVWDQLFFYRIINLYKTRQNPKVQTPSFENGALKIFWKANFSTISEMRKNMVSGENLRHSLKF